MKLSVLPASVCNFTFTFHFSIDERFRSQVTKAEEDETTKSTIIKVEFEGLWYLFSMELD